MVQNNISHQYILDFPVPTLVVFTIIQKNYKFKIVNGINNVGTMYIVKLTLKKK